MQNSIFSRARQLTELSKAGAFMQMQLLILLSVGYLSPWSLVYHGVQAKPSGACAISGLGICFASSFLLNTPLFVLASLFLS